MIIQATNLKKVFEDRGRRIPVMDGFTLTVDSGEFVTLFGPNGCGKTTFLYFVSALEQPDSGEVLYGNDSDSFEPPKVGFAFQDYGGALFHWLTVLDNISFAPGASGGDRKRLRRLAQAFLADNEWQELLENLDAYPYELSGGQKQMTAFARALFARTELLLLDEPFSSLDLRHRRLMYRILQRHWAEERNTVLFVSHELDEAILLADRFILLSHKPMRIIGEWQIDWPRPRSEELYADEQFAELRKDVLATLIGEVRQ